MKLHGIFSGFEELMDEFDHLGGGADTILSIVLFWLMIIFIICLVAIAFTIVARWIFYNKCGERGWKSIIPVYNEITLLKIAGLNWWWIFLIYASSFVSVFQSTINAANSEYSSVGLGIISIFVSIIAFTASIVTILAKINESINIAKKFNKNAGYGVLIFFFEPIMFLILGLSKSCVYDKDAKVSPNGFFGGNK